MAGAEKWEYTMFQERFGLLKNDQEDIWKDNAGRLRDLGILGWELVSVVATEYGLAYYFKRRLPQKEETSWPSPGQ